MKLRLVKMFSGGRLSNVKYRRRRSTIRETATVAKGEKKKKEEKEVIQLGLRHDINHRDDERGVVHTVAEKDDVVSSRRKKRKKRIKG